MARSKAPAPAASPRSSDSGCPSWTPNGVQAPLYCLTPSVYKRPQVNICSSRTRRGRVPVMGGGREYPGDLTPEQEQERFSTGGLGFEESLRRVLIGGPGEDSGETG